MKIVGLIYHDVVSESNHAASGFPGSSADSYKLTVDQFNQHLDVFKNARSVVQTCMLQDTDVSSSRRTNASVTLILTFDDGGVGAIQHTADLLEARGWKGCFFITTDYIGRAGFLNAEQIQDLHRRGHVIGSHSASHPIRMSACSPDELLREWSVSTQTLASIIGEPIVFASVPGGYYIPAIAKAAAKCGIRLLFTSEPTLSHTKVETCTVLGRFSVKARTPHQELRNLISARPTTLFKKKIFWDAKKILKKAGGRVWLSVRERLFDAAS